jgi:uncharacterized protein (TIGR02391 family)
MPGLMDLLPSADLLLDLEAEDLGLILLQLLQRERGPRFTLSNLEMPLWDVQSAAYPYQKRMLVGRALGEAWQWLQNEGLVMPDLDQPNGWFCLTRKGERLKSAANLDAYRAGNILPVAILHPRLLEKVRPMFLRGDYDVAVFQAFKEVEVAVRNAAGLPDDCVGVNLMRRAFHPDTGALTNHGAVTGEREAVGHMYSGAIGYCKNPPSHREVEIERVSAAQLIGLASYLLGRVETISADQSKATEAA